MTRSASTLGAAVLLILLAGAARADTLVVGSRKLSPPAEIRLVPGSDEVLAPLVPALSALGVSININQREGRVHIRPAVGAPLTLTAERITARLGDSEVRLDAAPVRAGDQFLLPAHSVARLLGLIARFDEPSRTLYLHPAVKDITVGSAIGKVAVTITSSFPFRYETGRLRNPSRLYVDLLDVDLPEGRREILVDQPPLLSVRAAQYSLAPDQVRVVLDLTGSGEYELQPSVDGRALTIEFPSALGPPSPPAALRSLGFARPAGGRPAEIVLGVQGSPICETTLDKESKCLELRLPGCDNKLTRSQLTPGDGLVKRIVASGGERGSDLTIRVELAELPTYTVRAQQGQIRVLLGSSAAVPAPPVQAQAPPTTPRSLAGMKVVLDPGHGGRQTGAVGPSGLKEKDVNLDVALRAARLLEQAGVTVSLTRSTDTALRPVPGGDRSALGRELAMRPAIANEMGADAFISIHCNASNPHSLFGTQVYFHSPASRRLAAVMHQELLRGMGLKDRGLLTANFAVLRHSKVPAVLLELAYIDHPNDGPLLADPDFRQKCAQAIVEGIRRYAESQDY